MIEPVEAEMARPAIYTDAQEEAFRDEDVEGQDLSRIGSTLGSQANQRDPADVEKQGGHIIVDFEPGANENPHEWSRGKKWYATLSCSFLCLAVALGSSMPTGDLFSQARDFHVGDEVIFLSISLFVVGFGVGPLLFAPLSEVVGRKPIYLVSMAFYFLFTLPSCLAKNAATMLVARLIAGISASAPMTNVGGSISDVWSVEDRGIPMAVFSATIFLGPCLGPLFGGWIADKTHQWRWIYWVLFIFIGFVFIATLFTPETLSVKLLRTKAKKLNKEHHTDVYISKHDVGAPPFKQSMKVAMVRPFILMFCEPIILFMSFYLSFIYALLYALFFAFPIAFEELRGWSAGMTGVAFVSIIIGMLLAMACMPYQEKLYKNHCKNGPIPEARLYPMLLGAIILPCSLFVFAFTSGPGISWVGPAFAGLMFGFCMILIYISANSYIVDSYANFAASAVAAKTLMRSLIGASVPLWVTQMFHGYSSDPYKSFQWAGLTIACVSVVIVFIPYVFYFKGRQIRHASKRAIHDHTYQAK